MNPQSNMRFGFGRSKRGCRTCRIRRVKCDEKKPACEKCSSTRRTCEWFSDGPAERATSPVAPLRLQQSNLPQFPDAKAQELRAFEFFLQRTAPDISSFFYSDFWQQTVLQLSHSEPCVLHAAIALGALHENEERFGMPVAKDRMWNIPHQFAVLNYNTAINRLVSPNRIISSDGLVVTLAACLIFTHIEILRGRLDLAVEHIRSGLNLLSEKGLGTGKEPIKKTMTIAFTRLDLQSAHFNDSETALRYPPSSLEDTLPMTALSGLEALQEAKRQGDMLYGASFRLWNTCSRRKGQACFVQERELAEEQQFLLNFHSEFFHQLESLQHYRDIAGSRRHLNSLVLLKVHALTTFLFVSVSLCEDEESAYDQYLWLFSDVITLAQDFISSYNGSESVKRPSFSSDWGIIPSLFFVAIKCRESATRRKAITLLNSWPHREGFWDSALISIFASNVVEMEETASQSTRTTQVYATIADDQNSGTMMWQTSNAQGAGQNQEMRINL